MKFITNIFLIFLLTTTVLKASQTQMLLDKLATASSADVAQTIITDIQEAWINSHSDQTEKLLMSKACLLYTSPSPRDRQKSRMPSSA